MAIDEQTRRTVDTMCLCSLDLGGEKGYFGRLEKTILKESKLLNVHIEDFLVKKNVVPVLNNMEKSISQVIQ